MVNKYLNFRITEIHAFLAVGSDTEEGVIAFMTATGGMMPMVAADPERLKQLKPLAKSFAKEHNQRVKLVRFSNREEIEEYN